MSKIYRFMSFESFIDMILRKELVFVHPTLWDDPCEMKYLKDNIKNKINQFRDITHPEVFESVVKNILLYKTFCQSWTRINESDALWRIYSHNCTSVRIEIDVSNIKLLDDIDILDVKYISDKDVVEPNGDGWYDLIKLKRYAFSHEQEVRLVKHYKYVNDDDLKDKLLSYLRLSGDRKFYQN